MPFLDSEIDLSKTVFTNSPFTNEHLNFARTYLTSAISKHDPSWLRKPVGHLRAYWNDNAVPAACYLIELSRTLSTLDKNITKKSEVVFVRKFKTLLRTRKEKEFNEILTELQVASLLSGRVSPIAFQPLVPEELLKTENEPPSPDFAIRLPGGDVFIEVTVLHFGVFIGWDESVEQFTSKIEMLLKRRNNRRIIYLYLPFSFRMSNLKQNIVADLVSEISSRDSGRVNVKMPSRNAVVIWEPLPHLDTGGKRPDKIPPGIRYATFGPIGSPLSCGILLASPPASHSGATVKFHGPPVGSIPGIATAFEIWPIEEELNDLFLKSLRNTLKRKREQFPHEAPYLLVVKLGHHRISADVTARLLTDRIWPNPEYAWISGICLFEPRVLSHVLGMPGSHIHDSLASLHLFINPHARNAALEELIALFNGERTFHL